MILLRIVDGRGLDSSLVRLTTRSWATHAEFVNVETRTAFGAYLQGVKERPIDYTKFTQAKYYTAPCITKAYQWALTQNGKPYDYSAIFGIFLDRNWRDPSRWFCSELVVSAFEHTDWILFNPDIQVWRITPRDLLLSSVLTEQDVKADWLVSKYGVL